MHFVGFLIIGGIAGFFAGKIMSGHGYGVVMDVILGVLGALVGGWLASTLLGIQATGLIISFLIALVGACLIVAVVRVIKGEPIRA